MIWIILKLAMIYFKHLKQRRLINLIRLSRFHETGGLPLFESCWSNSLLPRVFLSVAIQLEVEDQAGSKRRAGDPAPRKDCGPCVRVVSVSPESPHIRTFFPSCASRFETPRGKWTGCIRDQLHSEVQSEEDLTTAARTCDSATDKWVPRCPK